MISLLRLEATVPNWALAYRFDIVLRGREQTLRWITLMSGITPSQTVGPFFAPALTPGKDYPLASADLANDLITPDASGERIRIEGRVLDGDGAPVNDAMIEIWQADAAGRYAHPADAQRPNAKPSPASAAPAPTPKAASASAPSSRARLPGPERQAAGAAYSGRGVCARPAPHAYTRIYFADEAANAADPILALVPAERRDTLIAKKQTRDGKTVYRFDIRLQGEDETVFFDV